MCPSAAETRDLALDGCFSFLFSFLQSPWTRLSRAAGLCRPDHARCPFPARDPATGRHNREVGIVGVMRIIRWRGGRPFFRVAPDQGCRPLGHPQGRGRRSGSRDHSAERMFRRQLAFAPLSHGGHPGAPHMVAQRGATGTSGIEALCPQTTTAGMLTGSLPTRGCHRRRGRRRAAAGRRFGSGRAGRDAGGGAGPVVWVGYRSCHE
jgi:hypothetical protein